MSRVQFQGTPNPNAIKVLLPEPIVEGSLVVTKPEDAQGNQLALDLLALDGVTDLFFLQSFVTVSKQEDVDWDDLLEKVEGIVADHLDA
ncbi:MAG: NifU N-terminal domain-containing protein [Candidatus Thermoplasmatota archaeon]|nr:NifU N-terminal domain-containing protein [Candidatus Thermoplasmatota archaeon]